MKFRKGQRVVRLCSDATGRYVASRPWTIVRVSRRDGVIVIGDEHGLSHWTYDLDGKQREKGSFTSEIIELRAPSLRSLGAEVREPAEHLRDQRLRHDRVGQRLARHARRLEEAGAERRARSDEVRPLAIEQPAEERVLLRGR